MRPHRAVPVWFFRGIEFASGEPDAGRPEHARTEAGVVQLRRAFGCRNRSADLFATAALFVPKTTAIADGSPTFGMTLIAIYKAWGVVGHITRSLKIFLATLTALVVAFVALHLSGHSPHRHSH